MLPRRTIKFAPKVAEVDRKYEMNNNAELENGVYHHDEEKDGGVCNETKQSYKKKVEVCLYPFTTMNRFSLQVLESTSLNLSNKI